MQQERNAQPQNCYAQRGRAPNLTSAPRDAVTNVGCLLLCCPQLLLRNVTIDSITVSPLQTTFKPGVDYMTAYDDWLFVQVSHRVNVYATNFGRRKSSLSNEYSPYNRNGEANVAINVLSGLLLLIEDVLVTPSSIVILPSIYI